MRQEYFVTWRNLFGWLSESHNKEDSDKLEKKTVMMKLTKFHFKHFPDIVFWKWKSHQNLLTMSLSLCLESGPLHLQIQRPLVSENYLILDNCKIPALYSCLEYFHLTQIIQKWAHLYLRPYLYEDVPGSCSFPAPAFQAHPWAASHILPECYRCSVISSTATGFYSEAHCPLCAASDLDLFSLTGKILSKCLMFVIHGNSFFSLSSILL